VHNLKYEICILNFELYILKRFGSGGRIYYR